MKRSTHDPKFGVNELLIYFPQLERKSINHNKSKMKRIRMNSDEKIQKVLNKKQEIFHQQEAISDYLKDIKSERTQRYQRQKLKQIQNKAKYASDYNYKWKQRLQEQKCSVSAERDINLSQELLRDRCKSYAFPKIKGRESTRKNSEPQVSSLRRMGDQSSEYVKKMRKIVYCSYQKELNQVINKIISQKKIKRSYEIAAKIDKDDFRIMKYKTLDCRPKLPPYFQQQIVINYNNQKKRHSDNTFITSQ